MYIKILYLLTLISVLFSLYHIDDFAFQAMGIVELIVSCICVSVFLYYNKARDKLILWVFLLLIVIDGLGFFYETAYVSQIIPIIKIFIYLILAKRVIHRLQLLKGNKYMILFFSVVIVLNVFLLYKVLFGSETQAIAENRILFFLFGITLIIICSISVNYNYRYNTRRSMYFLYFIMASIISDVSWFIAFFLGMEIAYYIDTVFYIVSLLFMIKYAVETKSEREALATDDEFK